MENKTRNQTKFVSLMNNHRKVVVAIGAVGFAIAFSGIVFGPGVFVIGLAIMMLDAAAVVVSHRK